MEVDYAAENARVTQRRRSCVHEVGEEFMRYLTIAGLLLALALPSRAQKPKTVDSEAASIKSTAASPAVSKVQPRAQTSSPQDSFNQWEFWNNITIPAGAAINLDSQLDYSTTDTVRVTFRSAGADLGNLVVSAYWAIPQVDLFGVAEVVAGNSFPYLNAGGATFNTYGSILRVQVKNTGNAPMVLAQVLAFARVH
jgi:hypothetical protein